MTCAARGTKLRELAAKRWRETFEERSERAIDEFWDSCLARARRRVGRNDL
jgi:hypothetical protein